MRCARRIIIPVVLFFLIGLTCYAEKNLLTEEEMGDFVAEEGVCDIRLPDTCYTDPEAEETHSLVNLDKTILPESTLPTHIEDINISIKYREENPY